MSPDRQIIRTNLSENAACAAGSTIDKRNSRWFQSKISLLETYTTPVNIFATRVDGSVLELFRCLRNAGINTTNQNVPAA